MEIIVLSLNASQTWMGIIRPNIFLTKSQFFCLVYLAALFSNFHRFCGIFKLPNKIPKNCGHNVGIYAKKDYPLCNTSQY